MNDLIVKVVVGKEILQNVFALHKVSDVHVVIYVARIGLVLVDVLEINNG